MEKSTDRKAVCATGNRNSIVDKYMHNKHTITLDDGGNKNEVTRARAGGEAAPLRQGGGKVMHVSVVK